MSGAKKVLRQALNKLSPGLCSHTAMVVNYLNLPSSESLKTSWSKLGSLLEENSNETVFYANKMDSMNSDSEPIRSGPGQYNC